jgi:uncharacterized membrane protein (DUF106 family)
MNPLQIFDPTVLPTSTIVVTGAALGVNLLFSLGRRLLTDVKRSRQVRLEVQQYRSELRQAIMKKDKAKEEKLRKKDKQMREMEMKSSFENLKVTMLFMLPLLGLWYLLSSIVGLNSIVAISPIPLPLLVVEIPKEMSMWWWYLISSFAFSSTISKALGVGLD